MTAVRDRIAPADAPATKARPGRTTPVRRDLEGLRAIAVLGVVIYHLRPSWLPGGFVGVDVFFVLSGYLITGLLLREAAGSRTVDLRAFWGRRARRLLPASAVVLVGTVLASLIYVNSIDTDRFAHDGVFAAVFSVNWHYAALGTSYLADTDPSPFTHYWSLGVEEQFYLVWPVVLFAVVAVLRRMRRRTALLPAVRVLALVIGVASFITAWHLTTGDQPYAYFATYSRAWQLALGAVLAATPALTRLPLPVRTSARWAGVAAIVGFFVLAPLDVVYPGWFALVPALGAAAVIAAGAGVAGRVDTVRGDPVAMALRSTPAQLLGRYSYGWYLWHWPPLVLVPLAIGHPLSVRDLLGCAVISLACAVVSYHVLEHPVRASRALAARHGRRSLVLGAAIVVVGVGVSAASAGLASWRTDHTRITASGGTALHPQPGVAAAEQPTPFTDGCEVAVAAARLSPECRYLADQGHGDVVLVGDSHAVQWFPAVHDVAAAKGWGLRVWTRASCPFADVTKVLTGAPATACNTWRDDVMDRLVAARPSLVIATSYASIVPSLYNRNGDLVAGAGADRLYEAGLRTELSRLRQAGIAVLVIRDNPAFAQSGPKCALEHAADLAACSSSRLRTLRNSAELNAVRAVPGVHLLDNTSVFCDAARCHQVIGSTLAYRDANHLTAEIVTSLEDRLTAAATSAMAS